MRRVACFVSSRVSDDYEYEEFIQKWARRFGSYKYIQGSFIDECWAMIIFNNVTDAREFRKFLGLFQLAGYVKKPTTKFAYKVRGVYQDRWYGTSGKVLSYA